MSRERDALLWELFDLRIHPSQDVHTALQQILEKVADWFGATTASFFLNESDREMRCQASVGRELDRSITIQSGVGIAGRALELGKSLLIGNPQDPGEVDLRASFARDEIQSSLVVPLIPDHTAIGLLNLARSKDSTSFTEQDLVRADAVARHIALAVANWQLIEELHTAHAQLEHTISLLDAALFLFGENGDLYANPGARALLGKSTFEEWLKTLPDAAKGPIEAALALREPFRARLEIEPLGVTWRVQYAALSETRSLLVIEDLTPAIQAQQEINRYARLAEIGQMSAAIAHEIRNPLTGISSAAQMIQSCPDQAADLAEIIQEEAHKLNLLCNQFLDFAKPASLVKQDCRLGDLCMRVVELCRPEFHQSGVQLTCEFTTRSAPVLLLDARQVEQVLRNLLRNALEASEPGSTVRIEIGARGFSVHDQGPGMPPETVSQLFKPFFTTKPHGTGLGLCNCQKIIEAHSGSITVESEVGKGTRFTVQFAENLSVAA